VNLREFILSLVCIFLIMMGVASTLLSFRAPSSVEIVTSEVPSISSYTAWSKQCYVSENVSVCSYVPATYYTTLTLENYMTKTIAGRGPDVFSFGLGILAIVIGVIVLYATAIEHIKKEKE
jgi:uncharacterized membrane protein HdeD (DUF308 family)